MEVPLAVSRNRVLQKMFRVPGTIFSPRALHALANVQAEKFVANNNDLPCGYTYLGQLIDHDISHLSVSDDKPHFQAPTKIKVFQQASPILNLACIYDGRRTPMTGSGAFFSESHDVSGSWQKLRDFPRVQVNGLQKALIADERNDRNFLLARTQLLFMNAHNRLVGEFGLSAFEARQVLVNAYQRIILNDFLPRVLHPAVLPLVDGSAGVHPLIPEHLPVVLPLEFVVAAFRFGHALVRPVYTLNADQFVTLDQLLQMTGPGGAQRIDEVNLDWSFFYELDGSLPLEARSITTQLSAGLLLLKNEAKGNQNLLLRNLVRGVELELPDGQSIVRHIFEQRPDYADALSLQLMTPEQLREHEIGAVLDHQMLLGSTPLWTYLLMEPMANEGYEVHRRLGILGSLIVAEVFRGLLAQAVADDESPMSNIQTMPGLVSFVSE